MAIKGKGRTRTKQPVRAPRRGPVPVPVPFVRRRGVQVVAAFLVGALVFDLRVPASSARVALFVLSVVLAVGVAFGWRYLLGLTAFWLLDIRGANQLGWFTAQFLSGMFLPIVLFPDWLEGLARALPFASMLQLPVEVWLGKHPGADVLPVLAVQALWLVLLVLAGRTVMARALHRVVVQGG